MMRFKNKYKLLFLTLSMCVLFLHDMSAYAQRGGTRLVRDTEIEKMLNEWGAPIFKSAGLTPSAVNIILVQSNDINAFVAGGSNIFFYTGLLAKTENPGEVLGVMAHETGHISGGHLIKTRDALERASYESIISTIIGFGAAIATGDASAVPAIALGGQSIAQRSFLAHSRINEASADQAALQFLEKNKINPSGMETFFKKLEAQNYLPENQQSEYIRTHPLTSNRIDSVRHRIERSPYKDKAYPPKWVDDHARMKAKLIGFISPGQVPWVYNDQDKSIPARYARTIAAYRNNQVNAALKGIDGLLQTEPNNPYFLELKGQMLVDFSRVSEAVTYYRKAIRILPDAALFRIALAHALIESSKGEASKLQEAIEQLERAERDEPRTTRVHRLLATAHGKLGQHDLAKIHLAEEAVLQRNFEYAKQHANSVLQNVEEGSDIALKAHDILRFIENAKKG